MTLIMKQKLKIIIPILLLFLFVTPASAALVNCGTSFSKNQNCGIGDLIDGVFTIVNFLLGSATLVAIAFILFGGLRMILARGDAGAVGKAKSTMTEAIIGLIIIIIAYLIITSVTAYLTGQSLDCLRKNFLNFGGNTSQTCK